MPNHCQMWTDNEFHYIGSKWNVLLLPVMSSVAKRMHNMKNQMNLFQVDTCESLVMKIEPWSPWTRNNIMVMKSRWIWKSKLDLDHVKKEILLKMVRNPAQERETLCSDLPPRTRNENLAWLLPLDSWKQVLFLISTSFILDIKT